VKVTAKTDYRLEAQQKKREWQEVWLRRFGIHLARGQE
jgi:hypothetical protein